MVLRPGGAKAKGADGERAAAKLLAEWAAELGIELDPTRNLEQTRGGGYDLNGVWGLGIEVKRVETPNINSWWKQATRQAEADGTIPFLMHRANRKPWKFRVRAWVYPHGGHMLDIDLDLPQARLWFHAYLKENLEQINGTE